jgi:hypothetical protein
MLRRVLPILKFLEINLGVVVMLFVENFFSAVLGICVLEICDCGALFHADQQAQITTSFRLQPARLLAHHSSLTTHFDKEILP